MTILIALTPIYFVNAQVDTTELTILEYGLPPAMHYINARETVANKWGIQFISVAGCVVSSHLMDSVKKHNERTYTKIVEKFGKDWNINFDQEVQKELQIQDIVVQLIKSETYIIKLDSTLRSKNNGLYYDLTPEVTEKVYSAIIYGWGDWNGKTRIVKYYKLLIDIHNRTVSIVSDEMELYEFR